MDYRLRLLHRHRLVQMHTRVKNQLRVVALNEGLGPRPGLWSRKGQEQFRALRLPAWTERRRADNLELLADCCSAPRAAGCSGEAGGAAATRSRAADDASGSGSDYGAHVRAHPRRCPAVRLQQAGGQLSGADSGRRQFRRETTPGHITKQGNALLGSGSVKL